MFRRRQSTVKTITIGSLLNNRYRLQDQLGEGGAGVIFKAEDEQLNRIVAIKLLTGDSHLAGDKLERFRTEARSVARLNHPNIITLYDYEEEQGRPYLVIEYIPGQDLWELDGRYAPNLMPFEESLPIVDGILAALEYSHAHHVIHRDLKPENVMITPDKQVKVMDFGLARIEGQSRLTQEGLVAGTAAYLAPELALGEPGDHRVDLYAIGIILYELTTGRRPFSGDDPLTVISQHIHAPVVPPQRYNAAIPNDLQDIMLKLLAKRPEERYALAEQVRKELAPILTRLKTGGIDQVEPVTAERASASLSATQTLLDRIARGKLIGRESELQKLKNQWDMVRLGESQVEPLVLISGEAGIGKTRLLREFQVYTGLRDGYVLHGVAQEQDAGVPYAVFATILRNYIREQPAEVLRSQMSGFIAGEVVKLAPQLAEKIGHVQPNPALEPAAERERLLQQITYLLLNIARSQPTLLLIDDLHFTDPGSLDILEILLRRAAGSSLMVAAAYRDVALSYSHPVNRMVTSLEAEALASRIPLRRLPQPAVKQLLEALLGDTVSRKFVKAIYDATEGNPLFVEELIKSLVVDGQIRLRDGHWEQQNTSLMPIPGSIKAVLGKRLDRIKKETLELLRLAAVIGRNFSLDMLVEASPLKDEAIQWAIEEALSAQLIEVVKISDPPNRPASSDIVVYYQFQHALIRETLYEELRPLRQRQLHRRVAAAMEKLAKTIPIQNPAVLARHLIDSAQDERAVPYLREAGERAYQFYANNEVLDYLSQAYEILEDLAMDLTGEQQEANLRDRFDLLSRQRDVCNMMGDRDREFAALQCLQELTDMLADQKLRVEVMSWLSTYYWHVGNLEQAAETARQALKVARQNSDRPGEQAALERIARVLWTQRNPQSMEYATQALALAQMLEDRPREGRLTELVGHIFADTLYDPNRAALYFNQALEICRETRNPYEEAWTLWGMGGLAMLVNDYPAALTRYTEARRLAEDIGATLQVGWDLYHMGDAWYNLGNYEQSQDCYQQAQLIFNTSQHPRGKIYVLISLGLTVTALGELNNAPAYFEQAIRQAEERNDVRLMLRGYEGLAAYYYLLGNEDNLANGIRLSNRIIKLAAEAHHPEHELLGYHLRGKGFFEMRNVPEAFKSSNIAIKRLAYFNYIESRQISMAEIYYIYSRVAAAMGQADTAQTYLQKAYHETRRKLDLIRDEQQRRDFLNRVPVNREIVSIYP
jgi:tetratricopeptide (TPR) repeat protein